MDSLSVNMDSPSRSLTGSILPACRTRLEDPDDNVRVVAAEALIPTSTAIASLKVTLDVRSMRFVGLSYLNSSIRYLIEREFVALKGRGSWKERDFKKVL